MFVFPPPLFLPIQWSSQARGRATLREYAIHGLAVVVAAAVCPQAGTVTLADDDVELAPSLYIALVDILIEAKKMRGDCMPAAARSNGPTARQPTNSGTTARSMRTMNISQQYNAWTNIPAVCCLSKCGFVALTMCKYRMLVGVVCSSVLPCLCGVC